MKSTKMWNQEHMSELLDDGYAGVTERTPIELFNAGQHAFPGMFEQIFRSPEFHSPGKILTVSESAPTPPRGPGRPEARPV
ncbi:hypothetical protein GCM10009828_080560 [Actinoplanes couchii]|uniref:Uncharacterized protein n=1 Tax=Actinoplanes couchii TaxID=403638 RepID=A0ABQ3XK87_9ACTN|nr:hypothetical protein Aco03nite_073070 [Actinoplanes couchii]